MVRSHGSQLPDLLQDDRILRVFDRKGFFSVHGADANTIAQAFYKGTGVLKQLGKAPASLPSVTLNRSLFDQLLRTVLVEQADRIVEVYEGHGATWRLERCAALAPLSLAVLVKSSTNSPAWSLS